MPDPPAGSGGDTERPIRPPTYIIPPAWPTITRGQGGYGGRSSGTAPAPPVVRGRLFTDGLERDVYEHAAGRQYVLDGDGQRVYGQWLWPADEPHVVAAGGQA